MKTAVKVEDAVGMVLAHDITEVRPGEYKGPSFRKGHTVKDKDLSHLMRLGKRHLYILKLDSEHLHENEAALDMAEALAGPGVAFDPQPREGKVQFTAEHDGLLKVNAEPLIHFNLIPDVMCASLHNDTPVKKGQKLAGTKAIPLVIEKSTIDKAVDMARTHYPIFSVKKFRPLKCRLAITGSEVYDGLIEDKFAPVVTKKLEKYGASLAETVILPDNQDRIAGKIRSFLEKDTDMVIMTGGMSVDPDDVTRLGIRKAGIDHAFYGAAAFPGAMFLLAYKGDIPIIGLPASALYHQTTVFDLVLPRLLAGEKPNDEDLARFSHGGLCLDCPTCHFPACSFGKAICF